MNPLVLPYPQLRNAHPTTLESHSEDCGEPSRQHAGLALARLELLKLN